MNLTYIQKVNPYEVLNKLNDTDDKSCFNYEKAFGLSYYRYLADFKGDVSSDKRFQAYFVYLYSVHCSKDWCKRFFSIFQDYRKKAAQGEKPPTFEEILTAISPEDENTVHSSNASKMLNLLDSSKPLIDANIRNAMEWYVKNPLRQQKGSFKDRKRIAIENYQILESFYSEFAKTAKAEDCIACYDHVCPNYQNIDPVKKIDFVLWAMGFIDPKPTSEGD